ncbi:MAG: hypothetical protein H6993_13990 [Pseudomonadales bacterium]|nr:hypothetical protein [Pseudomonadales bacterium]MCP5185070.1 hypothetical protein [Pseudomonadales bacterium]
MSIRMDENSSGVSTLTLPETYTLFELEQALLSMGRRERVVLDMSAARVDHSAFELERLAAMLGKVTGEVLVKTADTLRFGFARTLMGYCSARNVRVHIERTLP